MLNKHGQWRSCVLPHITIVVCELVELDAVVVTTTGKHNHITGGLKQQMKEDILSLIYENDMSP